MIADSTGGKRMASVAFNVRVSLDTDGSVPIRSTGWAKIDVPGSTLGRRIKQYVLRTFRLSP
jgi:hypothetical protein